MQNSGRYGTDRFVVVRPCLTHRTMAERVGCGWASKSQAGVGERMLHLPEVLVQAVVAGMRCVQVAHGLHQHGERDGAFEVEMGAAVDGVGVAAGGADEFVEPLLLARPEFGAEGGVARLEGRDGVSDGRGGSAHESRSGQVDKTSRRGGVKPSRRRLA